MWNCESAPSCRDGKVKERYLCENGIDMSKGRVKEIVELHELDIVNRSSTVPNGHLPAKTTYGNFGSIITTIVVSDEQLLSSKQVGVSLFGTYNDRLTRAWQWLLCLFGSTLVYVARNHEQYLVKRRCNKLAGNREKTSLCSNSLSL